MTVDEQKRCAALAALDHLRPGMRLGLGSGAAVEHFVRALARRAREGLEVECIASSAAMFDLASRAGLQMTILDHDIMRSLGEHAQAVEGAQADASRTPDPGEAGHGRLPLSACEGAPMLDLMVEGADEIDANLAFNHSREGALLLGKILACTAREVLVIADQAARVGMLGGVPLAIEVARHGVSATAASIRQVLRNAGLSGVLSMRVRGSRPLFTDGGNVVIDAVVGDIADPRGMEAALKMIPGVVACSLYVALCTSLIVGSEGGAVMVRRR